MPKNVDHNRQNTAEVDQLNQTVLDLTRKLKDAATGEASIAAKLADAALKIKQMNQTISAIRTQKAGLEADANRLRDIEATLARTQEASVAVKTEEATLRAMSDRVAAKDAQIKVLEELLDSQEKELAKTKLAQEFNTTEANRGSSFTADVANSNQESVGATLMEEFQESADSSPLFEPDSQEQELGNVASGISPQVASAVGAEPTSYYVTPELAEDSALVRPASELLVVVQDGEDNAIPTLEELFGENGELNFEERNVDGAELLSIISASAAKFSRTNEGRNFIQEIMSEQGGYLPLDLTRFFTIDWAVTAVDVSQRVADVAGAVQAHARSLSLLPAKKLVEMTIAYIQTVADYMGASPPTLVASPLDANKRMPIDLQYFRTSSELVLNLFRCLGLMYRSIAKNVGTEAQPKRIDPNKPLFPIVGGKAIMSSSDLVIMQSLAISMMEASATPNLASTGQANTVSVGNKKRVITTNVLPVMHKYDRLAEGSVQEANFDKSIFVMAVNKRVKPNWWMGHADIVADSPPMGGIGDWVDAGINAMSQTFDVLKGDIVEAAVDTVDKYAGVFAQVVEIDDVEGAVSMVADLAMGTVATAQSQIAKGGNQLFNIWAPVVGFTGGDQNNPLPMLPGVALDKAFGVFKTEAWEAIRTIVNNKSVQDRVAQGQLAAAAGSAATLLSTGYLSKLESVVDKLATDGQIGTFTRVPVTSLNGPSPDALFHRQAMLNHYDEFSAQLGVHQFSSNDEHVAAQEATSVFPCKVALLNAGSRTGDNAISAVPHGVRFTERLNARVRNKPHPREQNEAVDAATPRQYGNQTPDWHPHAVEHRMSTTKFGSGDHQAFVPSEAATTGNLRSIELFSPFRKIGIRELVAMYTAYTTMNAQASLTSDRYDAALAADYKGDWPQPICHANWPLCYPGDGVAGGQQFGHGGYLPDSQGDDRPVEIPQQRMGSAIFASDYWPMWKDNIQGNATNAFAMPVVQGITTPRTPLFPLHGLEGGYGAVQHEQYTIIPEELRGGVRDVSIEATVMIGNIKGSKAWYPQWTYAPFTGSTKGCSGLLAATNVNYDELSDGGVNGWINATPIYASPQGNVGANMIIASPVPCIAMGGINAAKSFKTGGAADERYRANVFSYRGKANQSGVRAMRPVTTAIPTNAPGGIVDPSLQSDYDWIATTVSGAQPLIMWTSGATLADGVTPNLHPFVPHARHNSKALACQTSIVLCPAAYSAVTSAGPPEFTDLSGSTPLGADGLPLKDAEGNIISDPPGTRVLASVPLTMDKTAMPGGIPTVDRTDGSDQTVMDGMTIRLDQPRMAFGPYDGAPVGSVPAILARVYSSKLPSSTVITTGPEADDALFLTVRMTFTSDAREQAQTVQPKRSVVSYDPIEAEVETYEAPEFSAQDRTNTGFVDSGSQLSVPMLHPKDALTPIVVKDANLNIAAIATPGGIIGDGTQVGEAYNQTLQTLGLGLSGAASAYTYNDVTIDLDEQTVRLNSIPLVPYTLETQMKQALPGGGLLLRRGRSSLAVRGTFQAGTEAEDHSAQGVLAYADCHYAQVGDTRFFSNSSNLFVPAAGGDSGDYAVASSYPHHLLDVHSARIFHRVSDFVPQAVHARVIEPLCFPHLSVSSINGNANFLGANYLSIKHCGPARFADLPGASRADIYDGPSSAQGAFSGFRVGRNVGGETETLRVQELSARIEHDFVHAGALTKLSTFLLTHDGTGSPENNTVSSHYGNIAGVTVPFPLGIGNGPHEQPWLSGQLTEAGGAATVVDPGDVLVVAVFAPRDEAIATTGVVPADPPSWLPDPTRDARFTLRIASGYGPSSLDGDLRNPDLGATTSLESVTIERIHQQGCIFVPVVVAHDPLAVRDVPGQGRVFQLRISLLQEGATGVTEVLKYPVVVYRTTASVNYLSDSSVV